MPHIDALVLYAVLVVLRAWGLRARWKLASLRGDGWFFDTHFEADAARGALLGRYRLWLLIPSAIVEAIALADVLIAPSMLHIAWIHGPMTILLGVVRTITLRNFVLAARETQPRTEGAARVAISLETRRLADYSSRTFELLNTAIVVAALAIVLRGQWPPFILLAIVLVYAELGGLLWKRGFLRRAVAVPAEGADEFLRLTEEARRLMAGTIDWLRGLCTLALVLLAVRSLFWQEWEQRAVVIGPAVLVLYALLTSILFVRHTRRSRPLLARIRALQMPAPRRPLLDPENLHLGGLVYVNADNPAVVVNGGPFRVALNVVNKLTYVYLAYWTGWAVLIGRMVRGGRG
ncbi:MAG: hypothetical protein JOZ54_25035 [Acidobacteria bacterium]|nr:hypothetical protein [Acidobacteriota bacterium]